jgi:hypothetical protein
MAHNDDASVNPGKPPRPRFTVGRLIVAVAILAVVLGLPFGFLTRRAALYRRWAENSDATAAKFEDGARRAQERVIRAQEAMARAGEAGDYTALERAKQEVEQYRSMEDNLMSISKKARRRGLR